MKTGVIKKSKHKLPEYSTEPATGMDLRENLDGERICQVVINKQEKAEIEKVNMILESERGLGGFGDTGNK